MERKLVLLEHEIAGLKKNNDEIERLRKELAESDNKRMRMRTEYEEKMEFFRKENWRLTEEIKKHNEEFHREQKNKEDQINRLENDKKNLIKKKNKDDINKAYTITRLTYLEEETKRLKEEKKKIQDKNVNELRIQTEKLLDENLALKKQIHDL